MLHENNSKNVTLKLSLQHFFNRPYWTPRRTTFLKHLFSRVHSPNINSSNTVLLGPSPLNIHVNVTSQPSNIPPDPVWHKWHILVNTCMTMGPRPKAFQHCILIEAVCIIHRQNYFGAMVPGQRELRALLLSTLTRRILTIPDMCRAARVYHCPHYRPL